MSVRKRVSIVCSQRARTGKTLFARVLTEYLRQMGGDPGVFDTDVPGGTIMRYLPVESELVDIESIKGQMALFDSMLAYPGNNYVIDLSHHYTEGFFDLLDSVNFVEEAGDVGLDVVVFYICDRAMASMDTAQRIIRQFPNITFVLVHNEAVGSFFDENPGMALPASLTRQRQLNIPALDQVVVPIIESPDFSMERFITDEPRSMSIVARAAIRQWINRLIQQINHLHLRLELGDFTSSMD
jgi:hypothetical protein